MYNTTFSGETVDLFPLWFWLNEIQHSDMPDQNANIELFRMDLLSFKT